MNKNVLLLILSINLFMGSLFASPINDIDEDPWLRTFSEDTKTIIGDKLDLEVRKDVEVKGIGTINTYYLNYT
tara:strand:+ start:415 stop:633 length:219 start_codon:yes stop_codon:yes gene_type:complete